MATTKDKLRDKFALFKSGFWGRLVDITLGLILLLLGMYFWVEDDSITMLTMVLLFIGIFAFSAGAFNVCWAAPIIGIPFRGKDVERKKENQ